MATFIQVCVFGKCQTGKTTLTLRLLGECKEKILEDPDSIGNQTKDIVPYHLRLDNYHLSIIDTIGVGMEGNSEYFTIEEKFGPLSKYEEIIKGFILSSKCVIICFDLNEIDEKNSGGIEELELGHVNADKMTESSSKLYQYLTRIMEDVKRFLLFKLPILVVFMCVDKFFKSHEDELNRVIRQDKYRELVRHLGNHLNLDIKDNNILFYNIDKKFFDNLSGVSDLYLMKKVFQLSGVNFEDNYQRLYKDVLKSRYDAEERIAELLGEGNRRFIQTILEEIKEIPDDFYMNNRIATVERKIEAREKEIVELGLHPSRLQKALKLLEDPKQKLDEKRKISRQKLGELSQLEFDLDIFLQHLKNKHLTVESYENQYSEFEKRINNPALRKDDKDRLKLKLGICQDYKPSSCVIM